MTESGSVTMVTHFEVRDGAEGFEEAFAELARYFRGQSGFGWSILVRSLKEPNKYSAITQWTDPAGYEATTQSPMFFLYVEDISQLARIDADRTVPVDTASLGIPPVDGPGVLAQTTFTLRSGADAAAFETAFAAQAKHMGDQAGFLANSFLRSTRRDGGYSNLGWWRDPDSYLAVVQAPDFRTHAQQLGAAAEIVGGLYRPVLTLTPVVG
jgi:heme-degrading monooxygenase HmoA